MLNDVITRRVIESRLAECEQACMLTGSYLDSLMPDDTDEYRRAWDEHAAAVESERRARRALIKLAARRFNDAMAVA